MFGPVSASSPSLAQEVDALTVAILRMSTAQTAAESGVDVSAVTSRTEGGRSPATRELHSDHQHQHPSQPLHHAPPSVTVMATSGQRDRPPTPADDARQIATILQAPGSRGGVPMAPNRLWTNTAPLSVSSTIVRHTASAQAASPIEAALTRQHRGDSIQPATQPETGLVVPQSVSHAAAVVNQAATRIHDAAMQQVAANMTRLVHSAALLESQSHDLHRRDVSPRRRATAPQPSIVASSGAYSSSFASSDALPSSDSTLNSASTVTVLGHQLRGGLEQTKLLIQELHTMEVRMKKEIHDRERGFALERESWMTERHSLMEQMERLRAQLADSGDEKKRLLQMISDATDAHLRAEEEVRNAVYRVESLEVERQKDQAEWMQERDALKLQITRVRSQRDEAERQLMLRSKNFAAIAERLTESDAKLHVLRGHVHNLHVRDQEKDEHLHDVAMFVKNSLSPLVFQLEDLPTTGAAPLCQKCVHHHYQPTDDDGERVMSTTGKTKPTARVWK